MLAGAFRRPEGESAVDLEVDIGSFRVVRRLALGERSEVLLARAHGPYGFQRTVVLKRLIADHAREPQWLRRLGAEAIAYARLSHSAIVRLYDFVDLDGTPALVLEYVPGVSLDRLVRMHRELRTKLAIDQVLYVGARIFAALAAAHGARHPETGEFSPVIHRDVSPGNVLVSTHGEVKLSDFGVARVAGVTDATPSGTLLGTYGYMAPEQIVGDSITVRADVYGAGLLLWELLAGRHAFERNSLPELENLQAMAKPSIPPIESLRPDLPRPVCEALGRALRAEPDERISARDMLEALRSFVRSAEARGDLAGDVARARRMEATLPDIPLLSPSHPASRLRDPDATGDNPIPQITDAELPPLLPYVADSSAPPPPPTLRPPPPPLALETATPPAAIAPPFPAPPASPTPAARLGAPAIPLPSVPVRTDTPPAFALPSVRPVVHAAPPRPRGRFGGTFGLVVLAAAALSPLFVLARGVVVSHSASRPPPAAPEIPSMDRAAVEARTEVSVPVAPDTGLLETPSGMANHRIFVDGFARGTGGDVLTLRCGRREVQLGSAGRIQWVNVPCGGRIRIER
jgi:serine/threonine protein kinase